MALKLLKHKKHKITLISLAVLLLLIFGLAFFLNRYWAPILSDKVKNVVLSSTDSLYNINFSSAELDVLEGEIIIHNIDLKIDTNVYNRRKAQHLAPNNLTELHVKRLILSHIHPFKLYFRHIVDIDRISLSAPQVHMSYQLNHTKDTINKDHRTVWQKISKSLKYIHIGDIFLDDVKFKYDDYSGNKLLVSELKEMNLQANELLIDSATQTDKSRLLYCKDIFAELNNYKGKTSNGLYAYSVKKLKISTRSSQLNAEGLIFEPVNPHGFFDKTRKDRYTVHLDSLQLNNFDFLTYHKYRTLSAFNIVLLSATGSGKTLAFLLPTVAALDKDNKKTQALIVVPSRELAQQIETVFRQMGTGFKITNCYGGHKREIEENNLVQPPAIIVGTPGRLCDHLRRGNITADSITHLVLDEFDKSLELGFEEEMTFILQSLPNITHRMLTSATEAVEVPEFLGLEAPHRISFLTGEEADPTKLAIKMVLSPDRDKVDTLFRLICYLGNRSTIIFCNHRESVERTSELLSEKGITNEFYHGAMEQRERDSALAKFRNGSVNVLVTTDIAARGLDIPNIRYIVHYHLPFTEDIFTHRNGRTARMEASGTVILLLSPDEKVPDYVSTAPEEIELPEEAVIPEKPKWTTLFISAGKKDKVNKVDIVGFLSNKGELKKEDIGLIDVKDFFSFVAIRRSKASYTLHLIKEHKLKNKKLKIEVAK